MRMLLSAGLGGFAMLVVLSACSLTLPVRGQTETGDETFTGSATGDMSGAGTLTLRSDRGVTCTGDFVYVTSRRGDGTFRCSDGRSGPFAFVSTGTHGTGTGRIGG